MSKMLYKKSDSPRSIKVGGVNYDTRICADDEAEKEAKKDGFGSLPEKKKAAAKKTKAEK